MPGGQHPIVIIIIVIITDLASVPYLYRPTGALKGTHKEYPSRTPSGG
jgi:hypothetical protein